MRYTDALIDIAQKENKLDKFYSEFLELKTILQFENERIISLLTSPVLHKCEKKEIIETVFKLREFDKTIKIFFFMLIDNDREILMRYIFKTFNVRYNKIKNVMYCYVYTPYKLNEFENKMIAEYLKKTMNKTIVLNEILSNELIGGIKIQFGDKTIDFSIPSIIENLQKQLIN